MNEITGGTVAGAVAGIAALAAIGIKLQPYLSALRVDVATDEGRKKYVDELMRREDEAEKRIELLLAASAVDKAQIAGLTAKAEYLQREADTMRARIDELQRTVDRLMGLIITNPPTSTRGEAK